MTFSLILTSLSTVGENYQGKYGYKNKKTTKTMNVCVLCPYAEMYCIYLL